MKPAVAKILLICLLAALPSGIQAADAPRPNFLVILCDDLGYGDVKRLNPASKIATPVLDRFATEGVTFTDPQHGWTFTSAGLWVTTDGGAVWKRQSIIGPVLGY